MTRRALFFFCLLAPGILFAANARKEREHLADQAQEAANAGDHASSARYWEKALSAGATAAERRRWLPALGRAYESGGNYQKALQTYQDARDAEPKSVDRAVDLARVYDTVDLDDQALETYQWALAHSRGRRDIRMAVAELERVQGRLVEARSQAQLVVEQDPKDPSGQVLLARIEETAGDLPAAAKRRRDVLSRSPTTEGYYELGVLLARQDDLNGAAAAYEEAARRNLTTAEFAFRRGALAWRRGDPDEAETYWKTALTRDPSYYPAEVLLAVDDWERGRTSRALETLARAHIPPDSPSTPMRERILAILGNRP